MTNLVTSITNPRGTLASMGNVSIDNTGNQLFINLASNDYHLTTSAAICNVPGGGLTIAGITLDKDGVTRTATLPLINGCNSGNTGATGWSMGAYESN